MPKEQMELKMGTQEKSLMRNLTRALNNLAVSMQLYMPQKPKNSELRLTEPANLDEGGYVTGEMTPEEYEEANRKFKDKYATGGYTGTGKGYAVRVDEGCYIPGGNLSTENLKKLGALMETGETLDFTQAAGSTSNSRDS